MGGGRSKVLLSSCSYCANNILSLNWTFHFRMTSRPRTTSFVDSQKSANTNFAGMKISSKDGSKVMTVIASPGQGPDRSTEVSYTDTKVGSKAPSLSYQLRLFPCPGHWQWQLWCGVPGQAMRHGGDGGHQESSPGQKVSVSLAASSSSTFSSSGLRTESSKS